jgi:IclR family transcriptional regulator, KDG regulon repressor
MKDPSEYNVRAVERAIQILGCFDDEHPERGISDIAHEVDLHKATAHRIVTTLVNYGYLERADDGQRYRLGLELTSLGFKVIRRMDLRREALPYLSQLVQQWGESCDLGIFDQGEVFYIEVIQGNHALTIAAAVGRRLPAHCTASGKLFMAYLPPEESEGILSERLVAHTDNTITTRDELCEQLEIIRSQGYAVDNEEMEQGVRAVAAPVFNRRGEMVAAVSITSPTSRMTLDRIPEIANSLMESTRAISRRMGFNSQTNW